MSRIKLTVFSLLALSFSLLAAPARATIINLHADFDSLQMVPPVSSPAFGSADATLDDSTGAFTITLGAYQDLLGGANVVLLNDAVAGSNGPLIFSLTLDTPGAATGTFSGGGTLSAGQITDVAAGQGYIRVTSSVYPSGEIRGQLFSVPEPSSLALAAVGGLLSLAALRGRGRRDR